MKQNNFINLLKVDLKKSIKVIGFMVTIGLLCFIVPLLTMQKDESTTNIGLLIALLVVSCYVIPIMQNSYKMNKRKADRVYALPISTRMIAQEKLIIGLVEIIISYTFLYVFGFMIIVYKQPNFILCYYFPLYFIILMFAIILYLFNFFISSRANAIFDAILLVALWSFVFVTIAYFVTQLIDLVIYFYPSEVKKIGVECIPIYPFIEYGNFYSNWITSKVDKYGVALYTSDNPFQEITLFYFIFYPVLGVGSYLGIYFLSTKDRGETAEEISSGIFGYQPLMTIYLLYFTTLSLTTSQYALFAIGIATYLVLDVIHQRKFKLGKNSLIIMGITILVGVLLGVLFHETIFSKKMEPGMMDTESISYIKEMLPKWRV